VCVCVYLCVCVCVGEREKREKEKEINANIDRSYGTVRTDALTASSWYGAHQIGNARSAEKELATQDCWMGHARRLEGASRFETVV
jgi:hypothetical protein